MIKRIITGLILIAIATTVILKGGVYLFGFLLVAALLCCRELLSMLSKNHYKTVPFLSYGLVCLFFSSLVFDSTVSLWSTLFMKIYILVIVLWCMVEIRMGKVMFSNSGWVASLRIAAFFGPLFSFMYLIRMLENGVFLLGFCIAIIAASDIVALFGGKCFGKHSLSIISPNKTIEGSLCGVLGSVGVSFIFIYYLHLNINLYVGLAIIIAVISQLGDLHESLTKRTFGVKDSSNILPGHGGVYDRADSILFVVPLIYFLFQ